MARQNFRRELQEEMAKDVSTSDLARIVKAFPHLLSEAVRELNGEISYEMVEVQK